MSILRLSPRVPLLLQLAFKMVLHRIKAMQTGNAISDGLGHAPTHIDGIVLVDGRFNFFPYSPWSAKAAAWELLVPSPVHHNSDIHANLSQSLQILAVFGFYVNLVAVRT